MAKYSIFSLVRNALGCHEDRERTWWATATEPNFHDRRGERLDD
jgi:hypothetical protein